MLGRVVICGGSGLIGSELSRHLTSSGYEVSLVGRHPKPGEFGWNRLAEALEGSIAVVNLAGRSIACKFTEQNLREVFSSRVDSAKLVSDAISQCKVKPKKWLNASATGFYGNRGDEVLNENSQPGSTIPSQVCVQWEEACLKSAAETDKVVLRIGVVLSARGGVLSKLLPIVKIFAGGAASDGRQWISWIHLKDTVRMIQWVIENETPSIVSVSSYNPVQNCDFMAWLRRICGRPWSPPIPAFMLTLIGKLVGPDASLVLDSCRVVPTTLPEFSFDFPTLDSITYQDLV